MKQPLLTFGIPVYNKEKYITKCLSSFSDIGLPKDSFEVILVNDGSTYKSEEICKQFISKNKDLDIKYIYQENSGVSFSRNKCIENAMGKYIWFVDGDDYIEKEELKLLYEEVRNKEHDIFQFDFKKLVEGEKYSENNKWKREIKTIPGVDIIIKENITEPTIWCRLYKTEFLKKNNLEFNSSFMAEDLEFNLKAFSLASEIRLTPFSPYCWRTTDDDSMSSKKENIIKYVRDLNILIKTSYERTSDKKDIDYWLINMFVMLKWMLCWLDKYHGNKKEYYPDARRSAFLVLKTSVLKFKLSYMIISMACMLSPEFVIRMHKRIHK